MKNYFVNKNLYKNSKKFFKEGFLYSKFSKKYDMDVFIGWGRKKSGKKAVELAKKYNSSFILCEDGLYRSVKTGVEGEKSISIIKDNIGIYYDATSPSKLENILNEDNNFLSLNKNKIQYNIKYIIKKELSKYNFNEKVPKNLFCNKKKKLLFVSQTLNDLSLEYGLSDNFSDLDIVLEILKEYPTDTYDYYLKIHPETLLKNKLNDIDINTFKIYGFKILDKNYNPINLIKHFDIIVTKTSGMGFEALLLNKTVICYGAPFYSNWGLTIDKVKINRRIKKRTIEELFYAINVLYTTYISPFNKNEILIEEALQILNYFKNIEDINQGELHFYGFSIWKRNFIREFVKNNNFFFHQYSSSLKKIKRNKNFVWGMKKIKNIPNEISIDNKIEIIRVEDGFIRSVNLGSDLTKPLSLIFDRAGIYFNSHNKSDIENILNDDINFNDTLRAQGQRLISLLKKYNISKYNNFKLKKIENFDNKGKKKILVIGQVDNDASLLYNENYNLNNFNFLKEVKENNKECFIIYKPHPDILSGNRKGDFSIKKYSQYYDLLLKNTHITDAIKFSDEVHVMTSLSGLEGLILGKKVVCYGTPFYSNWGLTIDKVKINRRIKKRTIEELVAAVYILYPRYLDPYTNEYTDVFSIIEYLNKKRNINNFNFFKKLKRIFIQLGNKING